MSAAEDTNEGEQARHRRVQFGRERDGQAVTDAGLERCAQSSPADTAIGMIATGAFIASHLPRDMPRARQRQRASRRPLSAD